MNLSKDQIAFRNFVQSLPGCNEADRHSEQLVVHHVTYERFEEFSDEDVQVLCAHCLANRGIVAAVGANDLLGAYWDSAEFPYDQSAVRGDPRWRPGPDWPPSLRELEVRKVGARG